MIQTAQLKKQSLEFINMLEEKLFFEAHEALEKIWFPLRHQKSDEVILLRAYINAAVSFELVKRGREQSALKPWGFYLKNQTLIEHTSKEHQIFYEAIVVCITRTRTRIACFT